MNTPEDRQKAHQMVDGGARLLDVRTPQEFASGHLDGAVNVPLPELAARLADVGATTTPVVVYCQGGGRAARAEQLLRANGFTEVLNLGSLRNW